MLVTVGQWPGRSGHRSQSGHRRESHGKWVHIHPSDPSMGAATCCVSSRVFYVTSTAGL